MRQIIDRLCKGSVEELVSGVAEAKVLSKVDMDRMQKFVHKRRNKSILRMCRPGGLACRRHGTGAVRTAGQPCGCKTSGLDIRGPIDVVAPCLDGMGTKGVAARPGACGPGVCQWDIPSGCHPFNLGRTFASCCDRASPAATAPGRFEVSGPSETRAIPSN